MGSEGEEYVTRSSREHRERTVAWASPTSYHYNEVIVADALSSIKVVRVS